MLVMGSYSPHAANRLAERFGIVPDDALFERISAQISKTRAVEATPAEKLKASIDNGAVYTKPLEASRELWAIQLEGRWIELVLLHDLIVTVLPDRLTRSKVIPGAQRPRRRPGQGAR